MRRAVGRIHVIEVRLWRRRSIYEVPIVGAAALLWPRVRNRRDGIRWCSSVTISSAAQGVKQRPHERSNLSNLAGRGDELERRRTDRTGVTLERRR